MGIALFYVGLDQLMKTDNRANNWGSVHDVLVLNQQQGKA